MRSWRQYMVVVTGVEVIAVGIQAWALWRKWHAPWWSFGAQAFALACIICAAAFAIRLMWKNRHIPDWPYPEQSDTCPHGYTGNWSDDCPDCRH